MLKLTIPHTNCRASLYYHHGMSLSAEGAAASIHRITDAHCCTEAAWCRHKKCPRNSEKLGSSSIQQRWWQYVMIHRYGSQRGARGPGTRPPSPKILPADKSLAKTPAFGLIINLANVEGGSKYQSWVGHYKTWTDLPALLHIVNS